MKISRDDLVNKVFSVQQISNLCYVVRPYLTYILFLFVFAMHAGSTPTMTT